VGFLRGVADPEQDLAFKRCGQWAGPQPGASAGRSPSTTARAREIPWSSQLAATASGSPSCSTTTSATSPAIGQSTPSPRPAQGLGILTWGGGIWAPASVSPRRRGRRPRRHRGAGLGGLAGALLTRPAAVVRQLRHRGGARRLSRPTGKPRRRYGRGGGCRRRVQAAVPRYVARDAERHRADTDQARTLARVGASAMGDTARSSRRRSAPRARARSGASRCCRRGVTSKVPGGPPPTRCRRCALSGSLTRRPRRGAAASLSAPAPGAGPGRHQGEPGAHADRRAAREDLPARRIPLEFASRPESARLGRNHPDERPCRTAGGRAPPAAATQEHPAGNLRSSVERLSGGE